MKYARRSEAIAAFKDAGPELYRQWVADVEAWLNDVGPTGRTAMSGHIPDVRDVQDWLAERVMGELACDSCIDLSYRCGDGCCGPPESESFPCPPVRAMIDCGLWLPPLPHVPTVADYWDEQSVEVTLNHPTTIAGFHDRHPGETFTCRWSEARQMLKALRTESRELVESLA